jgi:hypothetical protein
VIWFNPGQTYTYYALLQGWPLAILLQEFAEALAQGAGFAGLLIFALRFPNDEPSPPWHRFEWTALALGAVIALLWLATFANAFGFPDRDARILGVPHRLCSRRGDPGDSPCSGAELCLCRIHNACYG